MGFGVPGWRGQAEFGVMGWRVFWWDFGYQSGDGRKVARRTGGTGLGNRIREEKKKEKIE